MTVKAKKRQVEEIDLSKIKIGADNVDEVLQQVSSKLHKVDDNEIPEFIIVDLFCGAGGTTTGIEMARILERKIAKVIACVNHDWKAILSHWRNHKDVLHFEEDIRTLDLSVLVKVVNYYRKLFPNAKLILWASLECTNFSKAKGGQPRDADSRTLADYLPRYIHAIDPDMIHIENVVEFMSWGPLDENGKPASRRNGEDWMRWRENICDYGYYDDWRELNSADFGAYTSRNRLFGQFVKCGLPIVWPEATHSKKPTGGMFGSLAPWKPVKDVLDFEDEGKSIFDRDKPLSDKTFERIYAGLIKYVAGGKKAFIQKHFSGSPSDKVVNIDGPTGSLTTTCHQSVIQAKFIVQRNTVNPESKIVSVDGPARTLTGTGGNQDLVQASFLLKYNSMSQKGVHIPPSVEDPAPTVACQPRMGLVQPAFLTKYHSGNPENMISSIDSPSPVLRTKDAQSFVQPVFLTKYHGNGGQWNSVEDPAPTLPTKDSVAKIQTVWLDKQYSGAANHQSVDQPAGSILSNDKHSKIQTVWIDRQFSSGTKDSSISEPIGSILPVPKSNLVQAEHFVMSTNFDNQPSGIEDPLGTVTANRKWHYLVNPTWGGNPGSTEAPCPTLIARQDKAPLYLVVTESGELAIQVYETDPEIVVKIKQFMADYGIVDIKMRMLKVPELLKIQGFPDDYKLEGSQADQKKFIGNSVHPLVPKAWYEAMAYKYSEIKSERA